MKIVRTHRVENSLPNKNKPTPYDIVMVYCRYCQQRLELHVNHSFGKFEHYQLINLPERIAKYLDTREIHCTKCSKDFVIEKITKETKSEFLLKLDCSNMGSGMESWYEDSIPKYSNETYA